MNLALGLLGVVGGAFLLTLLNLAVQGSKGHRAVTESFEGKGKHAMASLATLSLDEKLTYWITLTLDAHDHRPRAAFWSNLAWNGFAILSGWLLSALISPPKLFP